VTSPGPGGGFVDTHAHLDGYGSELPAVLSRAYHAGVRRIVAVGVDSRTSRHALTTIAKARAAGGLPAEPGPELALVVGLHPHYASGAAGELPALRSLVDEAIQSGVQVAIGEIGLDYFRNRSPHAAQRQAFWAQIEWAHQLKLPIVVHDREAHADVLAVLQGASPLPAGGVMHCYSGDLAMAEACIGLGMHISFAGPITYPSASGLRDLASHLPLERLLVETDCPYLTPVPHRGKPNEPAYVTFTARALAALRPEGVTATLDALEGNSGRVFFRDGAARPTVTA
jgi:TatD DNase family protein